MAILRYFSNGSLDPRFGSAGITVVDLGGDYDWPGGVALQDDGRILVSGYADNADNPGDFATLRFYGYTNTPSVVLPFQLLLLGD